MSVTTRDVLDHLSISVDVSTGIGKIHYSKIDLKHAEKIEEYPPFQEIIDVESDVDGEASSDESDSSEGLSNTDGDPDHHDGEPAPKTNGTKESGVKFEDTGLSKENRIDQVRQHLLLLSESRQQFVRHCARDAWTVDFEPLMDKLREAELDIIIERTSGRHGLRLARILRDKGKLDEKTLSVIALMKKSDVQNKMLEMQIAGFVEIQEIPRDAKSTASRTIFLWFSDTERCLSQILDNTYKTMLRCLQTLVVHRRKEKEVLALTQRSDVKGREKETMQKTYYEKFSRFLEVERKLLGQVMRLDELVAVLRDY
jgi:DNA-directed RNA polymerase III subunit RPC3